jgi:protein-tyrosine phosphatase family protein
MKKHVGHLDATLVWSTPFKIWAGSSGAAAPPGAVILGLVSAANRPTISGSVKIPELESPTLMIDWPDMHIPALDASQWHVIVKVLKERYSKRGVYVACAMGHGRTGTALAILGSLLGAIPKGECPVTYLRENYCEDMVESQDQLKYVAEITGRTVKAKQRKMWAVATGATGTSWDAWNDGDKGHSYPLSSGQSLKGSVKYASPRSTLNWSAINGGQPREKDKCFHYECKYRTAAHTGCEQHGHEPDPLVQTVKVATNPALVAPSSKSNAAALPYSTTRMDAAVADTVAAVNGRCGLCQQIPLALRVSYHMDGHVRKYVKGGA